MFCLLIHVCFLYLYMESFRVAFYLKEGIQAATGIQRWRHWPACASASGICLNVETTVCCLLKTLVQECKAAMSGGVGWGGGGGVHLGPNH